MAYAWGWPMVSSRADGHVGEGADERTGGPLPVAPLDELALLAEDISQSASWLIRTRTWSTASAFWP